MNHHPCTHYGLCGGCSLRQLPYETQLKQKEAAIRAAVSAAGAQRIDHILPSPEQEFHRNRMDFAFGTDEDGGLLLGLRQKGRFDRVVDIFDCRLFSELGNRVLAFTRGYFTRAGVPAYNPRAHTGLLRYVVLREAKKTKEFLVTLVTAECGESLAREYAVALTAACPGVSTVVWSVNTGVSDVSTGALREVLTGPGFITETLLNRSFRISPYSFFQTNTRGAALLYAEVCRCIREQAAPPVLFDLFSGAGGFGVVLADAARFVVSVELDFNALTDARDNARRNNVFNIGFVNGRVEKLLRALKISPADILILDPPRQGLQGKLVRRIVESAARRLVYVSCNPTTLALDLAGFVPAFTLEQVIPVDLFPHTPHVETICLLSR